MNLEQTQSYDDEINIGDLIRQLWAGKWIVSGITLVTVILAIMYLTVSPTNYTGTLDIYPLTTVKKANYQQLAESSLLNINNDDLELLFIEEIQTLTGIQQAIKTNRYLVKLDNESDLEFSTRLRKTALGFSVSKPSEKKGDKIQNKWQLKFETQQPVLVQKVIVDALTISNSNVKQQVQNNIHQAVKKHTRKLAGELKNIKIDTDILLRNAKLKTLSRIAFLKEQASMARSIKLDKDTFNEITFSSQSALVGNVNKEERFYLRGYIAIEQEIELLLKRKSEHLFIPQLITNQKRKQELEQDQEIKLLTELRSLTTIDTAAFESVSYDIVSTKFKNKVKPNLLLALAIILGGIMGIIVLLVRNTLIKED